MSFIGANTVAENEDTLDKDDLQFALLVCLSSIADSVELVDYATTDVILWGISWVYLLTELYVSLVAIILFI